MGLYHSIAFQNVAAFGADFATLNGVVGWSIDQNQTEFGGFGARQINNTNEANHQIPMPFAGNFTFIGCRISSNSLNVEATLGIRVNGVTGLTASITAATTGLFWGTGETAVAVDDLVCWVLSVPAGTGTAWIRGISAGVRLT